MAALSGGFEAGRDPCAAVEQVAEGIEFADAPSRPASQQPVPACPEPAHFSARLRACPGCPGPVRATPGGDDRQSGQARGVCTAAAARDKVLCVVPGPGLWPFARALDLAVHDVSSRPAGPAEDLEETLARLGMVPVLEDRPVVPAAPGGLPEQMLSQIGAALAAAPQWPAAGPPGITWQAVGRRPARQPGCRAGRAACDSRRGLRRRNTVPGQLPRHFAARG